MKRVLILFQTLACIALCSCGTKDSQEFLAVGTSPETDIEIVITLFSDATGITMTNAAAAGTELTSNISRAPVDFTKASQIRGHFSSSLTSSVVACRIEYSVDSGTTWSTLINNFTAGIVANQNNSSAYAAIPETAKAKVILRALVIGDGVLDPIIRYVRVGYY